MGLTFIFKDSPSHRPTISVATAHDGTSHRSFAVANLSGKYLTDGEARELAAEKADKNGFTAEQVVTRDMETHEVLKDK